MAQTLTIIDGFALIFRAYYAFIKRPLLTSRGENTSAVFGFFRTLFRLLRDETPEFLVVAWEGKGKTFRHELYPEYKANRLKAPEDLLAQIPWILELVQTLGIPSLAIDGFEADDVIAALVRDSRNDGFACRIISGDKDLLQLLGEGVEIFSGGSGDLTPLPVEAVREKFGVLPNQIADYLALVGDASDNVPGVPGIGKTGAAKLLAAYGSMEGIYEALPSMKPDATQRKLAEGEGLARLSLRLVRFDDPPLLPKRPADFRLGPLAGAAARPRLVELELTALANDPLIAGNNPTGAPPDTTSATTIQDGLFAEQPAAGPADANGRDYRLVTTLEELDSLVGALRKAGGFAIDCETTSLDPYAAELLGLSFSCESGVGYFVPLAHPESPLDPGAVLARIAPLLADPALAKIGQNLKFESSIFSRQGLAFAGIAFDTMLAGYLLDPGLRVNLDELALRHLEYKTIRYEEIVKDKSATLADVPLAEVARYAAEDAEVAYSLSLKLAPLLEKAGLWEVFRKIEMPLIPVLSSIELSGIAIDEGRMQALSAEFDKRLQELEQAIRAAAGEDFNLNSPKQLAVILFEKLGLPTGRKTKTGYSTDEEVLAELAPHHPIAGDLLTWRGLNKLKNTYTEVLPGLVNPATGRIHTSLNQAVTATGRLSSSDPNLQNIPIRTEEGRRIRAGFVPQPGWRFASADYSQIELRVLAALSEDPALTEAYRSGQDIHRRTAALVFDVPEASVTREQRGYAKAINFGVVYGQSAFGLSRELGIPRQEAARFIETYFLLYNGVRAFLDETIARARVEGCVRTWFGRQRRLPEITSRNKLTAAQGERLATNTRIQGTAADLIKLAMARVHERLQREGMEARLVLQVHDELLVETPPAESDAVCLILAEEMRAPWPFPIPLEIGIGKGANWDEAH